MVTDEVGGNLSTSDDLGSNRSGQLGKKKKPNFKHSKSGYAIKSQGSSERSLHASNSSGSLLTGEI